MKDMKTIERFIELRAQGLSFDRIAKKLKTSKQTLINWSKEYSEEIANLKAMELEALQEQYFLSKAGRIRLLGEKIEALKNELDKRDLSDIPTGKLFELLSRYHELIKKEAVTPVFRSEEEIEGDKAMRSELERLTRPLR